MVSMQHTKDQVKKLVVVSMDLMLDQGWWPADIAAVLSINVNKVYARTKARRALGDYRGTAQARYVSQSYAA